MTCFHKYGEFQGCPVFKKHMYAYMNCSKNTVGFFFSLPVKIQDDSYSSGTDESKYDNQISLSSTNVKEKGLDSKTMFVYKKYYTGF